LSFHPTINAVYWVENTHIRKEFILVLQDSLNRSVPFESFFFKLYGNFVYNHLLCETLSGESIEEAVCREVKEESNVDIDINKVVYVASQPWPFGGQIMIGCFAQATSTQIELTTELRELEVTHFSFVRIHYF
jgi:8-oxo-dGTP pyrophosphatase MutT (NUDIX family)